MSYIAEEAYEVYREEVRKARKEHKCDACKRTIRPGDYYCNIFVVFDGDEETIKRCGACQKTHEHLRTRCREEDRDLWPDERLNCGMDYEEEWGELPDDIAALAFVPDAEAGALLQKKAAP